MRCDDGYLKVAITSSNINSFEDLRNGEFADRDGRVDSYCDWCGL